MRARENDDAELFAFRIYATDALMHAAKNTASAAGRGGYLDGRWIDVIDPQPKDTRDAAEIAVDFVQKYGLQFQD